MENEENIKIIQEDLENEKIYLREKIQQYYKFFTFIKPPKKKLITFEDLERELARCELEIQKKGNPTEDFKSMIILGAKTLESLTPIVVDKSTFDLTGYGNIVSANKDNEEFDKALKEIIIKYDLYTTSCSSPEFRLLKLLGAQALLVNELNQKNTKSFSNEVKNKK